MFINCLRKIYRMNHIVKKYYYVKQKGANIDSSKTKLIPKIKKTWEIVNVMYHLSITNLFAPILQML